MNRFTKLIQTICLSILIMTVTIRAGEIHDAAAAGDLNMVQTLLDSDPNLLESKDSDGNTPLITACLNKQIVLANMLIDKGADVNARGRFQFTVLTWASDVPEQDTDLLQRLIDKGADVKARGIQETTALHRAALSGGYEVAKLLVENGAEINVVGYNGITPLHRAAQRGKLKVISLLIEHGADVNIFDKYTGPTGPWDISGTILQTAINHSRNEEAAKLLVKTGTLLNKKDSNGNSELHLAVLKGYAELAKLLTDNGADINAVNEYNRTPLYYAAKHGYRSVAESLIAAGADQSVISETNYDKAAQLTEVLPQGEAYIWHMDYTFVVKTKNNLLIFTSNNSISDSPEAGLANGHLNPKELAGQKITIFTRHRDRWHMPTEDFIQYPKLASDINIISSFNPDFSKVNKDEVPGYHFASPNESFSIDGIQVHTIPALGGGMGYLVEADGVKIFHAGLHVSDNDPANIEKYRKEINFLKPFGPVDIAMVSVLSHSNRIEVAHEPSLYLLDQLSPKVVYLFGANNDEQYPVCAEVLRQRDIPIIYPEIKMARSERFHYIKQEFTDLYGDYLGQTPPGDTPEVFAPGIVSTIYMEHSTLSFSPDGNEVFWRVEWGPGLDRSLYNPDTWISNKTMKRIGDRWTEPMASPYRGTPVFSHDGKRIYFSDYYAEKNGSTWGEPQNLGLVERFPELKSIYQPTITRDGILYFSSDTAGLGRIKDHVIFRTKLLNGKYTKLERLPGCINLPSSWNYSACIAPDEGYLIFSSNRPGSLDNFGDLYISFHNINTDTWSEPINLGEPINTRGQDSSPGLSPDGKYLFYTGSIAGRQAEIFWVSTEIIEKLRAKVSGSHSTNINTHRKKSK